MSLERTTLVLLVVLSVITSHGALAARQLFKHPHHPVTWTTERCDQESEITISTQRPWDLEGDSRILKGLVRSAGLAIAFECPALERLNYRVRDLETDESLYSGSATRDSGWQPSSWSSTTSPQDPNQSSSVFRVAGVELGMTIDEARSIMREQFGDEPSYRSRARMLVSRNGRCRFDADNDRHLMSDDNRCMRVWMSNHTRPQVERVKLVHDLPQRLGVDIDEALRQRFGRPVEVKPVYARGYEGRRMVWGRQLATQQGQYRAPEETEYELEAEVFESANSTRIVLRLGGSSLNLATMADDDFNVLDWQTPKY